MQSQIPIEIITDSDYFIERLKNPKADVIYGYLGKYKSISDKSYDIIKDTFSQRETIGCIYSDIFLNKENVRYPMLYKSFHPEMFKSKVLFHCPIFIRTDIPIDLHNEPKLHIVNSHIWIQEAQTKVVPYHIPECLFELVMTNENNDLLQQDTNTLNACSNS